MAKALEDKDILLQAYHCGFPTRFFRGQFRDALDHVEAGVALYDRERHAHHRHVYLGHDPYVCGMQFGAVTRFVLGYPEQALRVALDTVEFARSLDHSPSLAHALWHICLVFAMRNDSDALTPLTSELIALSDAHGLPLPRAHAMGFLGWALTHCGEVADGVAQLEEAERLLSRLGSAVFATFASGVHAETLLAAGRYMEALAQAERALTAKPAVSEPTSRACFGPAPRCCCICAAPRTPR